jgi:hypothetical protein
MAEKHQLVRTANFAAVEIDGKRVGLAQDVRGQIGYGLNPLYHIGDIDPQENVPTRATYRVTLRRAVLLVDDGLLQNIIPKNGKEALEGLVFDLVIYDLRADRTQGEPLRAFLHCSYDSGGFNVSANQIIFRDATFMALTVDGEGL